VWTLGIVSLLMDTSSELIHSLLPLFLVTTLGVSALAVGVIEGVAEATALCVKVFSGYLSDYFRRRKLLTVLGYGLAALSKPLFPLLRRALPNQVLSTRQIGLAMLNLARRGYAKRVLETRNIREAASG